VPDPSLSRLTALLLPPNPSDQDDVHLSYLPLAHMLERVVVTFMLSAGAQIGFFSGSVDTLFDDISTHPHASTREHVCGCRRRHSPRNGLACALIEHTRS
jgi:hypothetical protein